MSVKFVSATENSFSLNGGGGRGMKRCKPFKFIITRATPVQLFTIYKLSEITKANHVLVFTISKFSISKF